MNAAPCSCRVVMWRTASWRLSASRMSIVSSPGTEKTYSHSSAARHSTRREAAVRAGAAAISARVYRSRPLANRDAPGAASACDLEDARRHDREEADDHAC